jgi:putative membrane protein
MEILSDLVYSCDMNILNIFKRKQEHSTKDYLRLFFTGFTMGSADIVPGVSGGTIAFIFGVYEELIDSIKTVSGEVLKLFFKGKFKEGWSKIPFHFLIPLGLGLVTAVLTLTELLSHLLDTQPVKIWSFFFGLVLASVFLVSKRIVSWDLKDVGFMLLFTAIAYNIVGSVPLETPENPIAFMLAGAVAICAMILPGVSGSFLLIIMGKYEQVLTAITTKDFMTIGFIGIGAVLGLALFSRVLSWLFKKHHDVVVAALTGFMIGSLRKIWPWKETLSTRINSHGVEVPLLQQNVLPEAFDMSVMTAVGLCLLAILLIVFLDRLQLTKERTEDIDDPQFTKEHKKALKSQKH